MFIIKKSKNKISSLLAREINGNQIKSLSSKLAGDILRTISAKPSYPKEIAKKLNIHEQKVYYHIRNLEKSKIIEIAKQENIQGAIANFYKINSSAFFIKFEDFKENTNVSNINTDESNKFLDPFIDQGKLNAKIIVGSPDPHGPEKARSRDGYYGIDLALFLGSFLNYHPELNVKLDTETRTEDLMENLIILGGPIINTVSIKINNLSPIRFNEKDNWNIISKISGKTYYSDETGLLVKMKNPFNKKKYILWIAGKRSTGTKSVIISFLKYFKDISNGNLINNKIDAKVIEGIDMNSDGIVDDIEILE